MYDALAAFCATEPLAHGCAPQLGVQPVVEQVGDTVDPRVSAYVNMYPPQGPAVTKPSTKKPGGLLGPASGVIVVDASLGVPSLGVPSFPALPPLAEPPDVPPVPAVPLADPPMFCPEPPVDPVLPAIPPADGPEPADPLAPPEPLEPAPMRSTLEVPEQARANNDSAAPKSRFATQVARVM